MKRTLRRVLWPTIVMALNIVLAQTPTHIREMQNLIVMIEGNLPDPKFPNEKERAAGIIMGQRAKGVLVATARHAVRDRSSGKNARNLRVFFATRRDASYRADLLTDAFPDDDLAFLLVPGVELDDLNLPSFGTINNANFTNSGVNVNEEVYSIGQGDGVPWNTLGPNDVEASNSETGELSFEGNVPQGQSGGALLRASDGRIVGMVTRNTSGEGRATDITRLYGYAYSVYPPENEISPYTIPSKQLRIFDAFRPNFVSNDRQDKLRLFQGEPDLSGDFEQCGGRKTCYKIVWNVDRDPDPLSLGESAVPTPRNSQAWARVAWLHPNADPNSWRRQPPAGCDLSGAGEVKFMARGQTGGEIVTVEILRHPTKDPFRKDLVLTDSWHEYTIDLSTLDGLQDVVSAFGIRLNRIHYPDPGSVGIYLADPRYSDLTPAHVEACEAPAQPDLVAERPSSEPLSVAINMGGLWLREGDPPIDLTFDFGQTFKQITRVQERISFRGDLLDDGDEIFFGVGGISSWSNGSVSSYALEGGRDTFEAFLDGEHSINLSVGKGSLNIERIELLLWRN